MISAKFVQLIEQNCDRIVELVIKRLRRGSQAARFQAVMESELREWGHDLLGRLGHWLSPGAVEELELRYTGLGARLFQEDIPLTDSLRGLFLMRERILDYLEEQVASKSTMDLYAEEELDRRLARFFDRLAVYVTRGYEQALRKGRGRSATA